MNLSVLQLSIAFGLISLGSYLALHERRNATEFKTATPGRSRNDAARVRRRVKIAALLVFIGILFACGGWTDPRLDPVRFLAIWGFAFLLSLALLWHGFIDFFALRKQRLDYRLRTKIEAAERHVEAARHGTYLDGAKPESSPPSDGDDSTG